MFSPERHAADFDGSSKLIGRFIPAAFADAGAAFADAGAIDGGDIDDSDGDVNWLERRSIELASLDALLTARAAA